MKTKLQDDKALKEQSDLQESIGNLSTGALLAKAKSEQDMDKSESSLNLSPKTRPQHLIFNPEKNADTATQCDKSLGDSSDLQESIGNLSFGALLAKAKAEKEMDQSESSLDLSPKTRPQHLIFNPEQNAPDLESSYSTLGGSVSSLSKTDIFQWQPSFVSTSKDILPPASDTANDEVSHDSSVEEHEKRDQFPPVSAPLVSPLLSPKAALRRKTVNIFKRGVTKVIMIQRFLGKTYDELTEGSKRADLASFERSQTKFINWEDDDDESFGEVGRVRFSKHNKTFEIEDLTRRDTTWGYIWDDIYFDEEALAEFKYAAFMEECGLEGGDILDDDDDVELSLEEIIEIVRAEHAKSLPSSTALAGLEEDKPILDTSNRSLDGSGDIGNMSFGALLAQARGCDSDEDKGEGSTDLADMSFGALLSQARSGDSDEEKDKAPNKEDADLSPNAEETKISKRYRFTGYRSSTTSTDLVDMSFGALLSQARGGDSEEEKDKERDPNEEDGDLSPNAEKRETIVVVTADTLEGSTTVDETEELHVFGTGLTKKISTEDKLMAKSEEADGFSDDERSTGLEEKLVSEDAGGLGDVATKVTIVEELPGATETHVASGADKDITEETVDEGETDLKKEETDFCNHVERAKIETENAIAEGTDHKLEGSITKGGVVEESPNLSDPHVSSPSTKRSGSLVEIMDGHDRHSLFISSNEVQIMMEETPLLYWQVPSPGVNGNTNAYHFSSITKSSATPERAKKYPSRQSNRTPTRVNMLGEVEDNIINTSSPTPAIAANERVKDNVNVSPPGDFISGGTQVPKASSNTLHQRKVSFANPSGDSIPERAGIWKATSNAEHRSGSFQRFQQRVKRVFRGKQSSRIKGQ